jgi:hypothetical protein
MANDRTFMHHPQPPNDSTPPRMRIERPPGIEQGPEADGTAPISMDAGGRAEAPATAARRIFICYPRTALAETGKFHQALLERLRVRSRSYELFRDLGEDPQERLNPGDQWRPKIEGKLKEAICCIVILVPSIFESEECAREIEHFNTLSQNGSGRFLFPIQFVSVAAELKNLAGGQNYIAAIMRDTHLYDFSGFAYETERAYGKRVDEIADTIHALINRRAAGGSSLSLTGGRPGETGAGPSRLKFALAALAALALIGIAIVATIGGASCRILPSSSCIDWVTSKATFDLVMPVRALTEPRIDAGDAPPLDAALFHSRDGAVAEVREGQVNGKLWYKFKMADHTKRYVPADRIPAWLPVDPNLELTGPVEGRAKPQNNAAVVRTLDPGELGRSAKLRAPRKGTIDNETWFRIASKGNDDIFFSEHAARKRLVQWDTVDGCLVAKRRFMARSGLGDGTTMSDFVAGETIKGVDLLQRARVEAGQWYRFRIRAGEFQHAGEADVMVQKCP